MQRNRIEMGDFKKEMGVAPHVSFKGQKHKEILFENNPAKYPPEAYPAENTPFGNINIEENPVIEIAMKQGLIMILDDGRAWVTIKGKEFLECHNKKNFENGYFDGQDRVPFFGRLDKKDIENNGYLKWGLENGLLEQEGEGEIKVKVPEGYEFLNTLKNLNTAFAVDGDKYAYSKFTDAGGTLAQRAKERKRDQRDKYRQTLEKILKGR
ncbi:MAG: hypothetical protein WA057_00860 [Candidatus Magasanikiibacteriota bacterium]